MSQKGPHQESLLLQEIDGTNQIDGKFEKEKSTHEAKVKTCETVIKNADEKIKASKAVIAEKTIALIIEDFRSFIFCLTSVQH